MGDATAPPIDARRLERLLAGLLDVYSPSGREEQAVELAAAALSRAGLPVERLVVDDGRANLVVPLGPGEPRLALVGHLDTIAAHDLEDLESRRDGERFVGLGAADMKGGCAAMIEAAVAVWEGGARDLPVALCLVVGEEEEGDGTERLLETVRPSWAVVGEPTDLSPCLCHYGYVEVGLEARGKRLHASLAGEAEGAVPAMLRFVLGLSSFVRDRWPEVAFNIRGLSSSPPGFVVPDRCDARLDLHLPPSAPVGEMTAELEEEAQRLGAQAGEVELKLWFDTIDRGYDLPERGPLVDALRAAFSARSLPWTPSPFRSRSDASLLFAEGVRPIILGPGSLEAAHSPGEWVSFPQVLLAAELYAAVALRMRT